ncbi:hypothetical protein [Apibacter sp. HY039]|uniref:hypothetical protein n=1 Tax=Apibacter sp. HY039 TaxID=2501476 RepID=UPI000FEBCD43|nr:hypothetical protein [Apibacter sp. HY039]
MKKIYYLHGYRTSGKKFECIKEFYSDFPDFQPIYWEWDEYMNIPEFLTQKVNILKNETFPHILMADSMGANLAWYLVNEFPDLKYVMTNPVFSAEQIKDQYRILPDMRNKIFNATHENIVNKNVSLIISKNDETLDSKYYKRIFDEAVKVNIIEDVHAIIHIKEYMPMIHQLVEEAFTS